MSPDDRIFFPEGEKIKTAKQKRETGQRLRRRRKKETGNEEGSNVHNFPYLSKTWEEWTPPTLPPF
jgi:hypothetical protein